MRRLPLIALILILLGGAGVAGTRYWLHRSPQFGSRSEVAVASYVEGENALRRFEFERAREAFLRAVTADSTFALAQLQLGRACGSLGQVEAMRRHLDLAATWADSTATQEEHWRIRYAVAAHRGEVGEREHAMEQLERDYADSEHTLVLLAERAKQDQKLDLAETLFRRVLQQNPTRVDVHNQLGYIALENGEYEKAVTSLQRYAYYAPDAANPHDSLGEAYLLTGRYHQSWEEYLRALEIDPTFVNSAIGACDAFTITGQCKRALKLLDATEGLLIERGRAGLVPVKRMQVLYSGHRWSEVVHGVDTALGQELMQKPSTRGQQMWLRALRTLALAKQGQLELAAAHMDTALTLLDSIQASLGAEATFVREELELLEASLRVFLAVRTDHDAAARLADLRSLIEASRRRPHRLLPYRTSLSDALFEYGLYEEAIEVAGEVLQFNPRNPHANLISCKSYLRLHRRDEALGYLQAYLEMMRLADEDHPEVTEAQRILQQVMPSS